MFGNIHEIYDAICREVSKDPGSSANGHCPCHSDSTGSLSVDLKDGKNGKKLIVIKCFAGCDTKQIVTDLGFAWSDLFEGGAEKPAQKNRSHITIEQLARAKKLPADFIKQFGLQEIEDEYYGEYIEIPYFDIHKKNIIARRKRLGVKGGDSRWSKGDKPPIYAQWSLPKIREMRYVVFCEGESDTWTLWFHGYPALGLPGASTAKKLQFKHIEGLERIWVFVEPDQGGATMADSIPRRLKELGYQGELYRVYLQNFKDPNELHKAVDGDKTEFRRVFQAAMDSKTALEITCPSAVKAAPERGKALTDMGNAERLAILHGRDLRFVRDWGAWFVWDGVYWKKDRVGEVKKKACATIRTLYAEGSQAEDDYLRKEIIKHATQSENNGRIESMIRLAEIEDGMPMTPEQFDQDPWLFTVRNGTIDLRTGRFLTSQRDNYISKCAPVSYDPDAKCPTFEKFLDTIFEGNQNLITFVRRAIGYTLTGRVSERCLFILHGCGKNGKSTLLEVVMALLGEAADGGYGLRTPTETLMVQYGGGGIPNDIARLKGARYVSASETEEGNRFAEARIKDLTGGDTISARFMRGEFFDFRPEFKLWIATNHKPAIRGTDNAIWDRIRLIPFNWRVPDGQADPFLPERLCGELSGVLNWALSGCLEWQREGLGMPSEVINAVSEYRAEMDILADFMSDCCLLAMNLRSGNKELYAEYHKWCELNAQKMVSHRKFSQRLIERGLTQTKSGSERIWHGIGLLKDEEFNDFGNMENSEKRDGWDTSGIDSHLSSLKNAREEIIGKSAPQVSQASQIKLSAFD